MFQAGPQRREHPARRRKSASGLGGDRLRQADRSTAAVSRSCAVPEAVSRTTSRTAEEIVRQGFTDRDPEYGEDKELPASVILLDAPVFRDAYDLEVVVVEIAEAVVLPCEWITETRSHRRFMVPADVVNAHGRVSNWEG
jgi:hypothetical protein